MLKKSGSVILANSIVALCHGTEEDKSFRIKASVIQSEVGGLAQVSLNDQFTLDSGN